MDKQKEPIHKNGKLRQIAEKLLNRKEKASEVPDAEPETLRLIRELELHQIELEMQNSELQLAKENAEHAEKKYTELYDSSPSGYLSLSKKGRIADLNISTSLLLGKKRSSLIHSSFGFFVSSDTRAIFNSFIEKMFETKLKQSCEFKLICVDDSIRYIYAEGIISNMEEQSLVTLIDISKRKLAEQTLRESEEKFNSTMEDSADAVFLTDNMGKVVYVNSRAVTLLGYSKEEILGLTMTDLSPKEKEENYFKIFEKLTKNGNFLIEIELQKKDGTTIPTDLNAILLPNGMVYVRCRDISIRKNALRLVHDSEEKYRSVAQSAADAIITADNSGSIIAWNRAAEKIFGYTADEIIGKELNKLVPEKILKNHNDIIKRIEQVGAQSIIGEISESVGLHKNGQSFPIEFSMSLFEKSSKKFYTGIIRDITERKQTDQELINAKLNAEESDRLKSAFLANMGHEIRTPMNGILGFTELLKTPKLTGDEQQEYIDIIQKSGTRMLHIINDIISISKIQSEQTEVFISNIDINEQLYYVHHFFKLEAEQKKLRINLKNELNGNKVIIRTDREKLFAVLTNLVENAIKFTQTGSIELGYHLKGEFLEFYVKDTGLGIPEEHLEIIFERFRQGSESLNRNYEGSGLGLAISKAYIEILGGRIWVESGIGQGTTMRFTIPYLKGVEMDEPLQNDNKSESSLTNKLKILVADDDEISRKLFKVLIKPSPGNYFRASNGHEAVKVCRHNPSINLVLMDLRMPGMDGYEATRKIREFNKEIVIIAQTAYALPGDREKAMEAGCTDYISKPIDRVALIELMRIKS